MVWWERVLGAVCLLAASLPAHSRHLTFVIQPVRLSDDDGARGSRITPAQIGAWVSHANAVWRQARIGFALENGIAEVRDSLLNRMMGVTDGDWDRERAEANRIVTRYPGRVVVFFRYGPGPEPTRECFSWSDVGFVVMGGFEGNYLCGRENLDLLAHELGHYFGLNHTFDRTYATAKEADRDLRARQSAPGASDAFPPFIRALQCSPDTTVSLAGRSYAIPRDNVMSYYGSGSGEPPRRRLTAGQVAWARRIAELRLRGGGRLPSNTGAEMSVELERAPLSGGKGVVAEAEVTGETWSAGRAQFFRAVASGWSAVSFPVDKAGKYRLELFAGLGPDYGNLSVWLDGRQVKRKIRLWSPLLTPSGPMPIVETALSPGSHTLRLEVAGKEPLSRGYNFTLDGIRIVRLK